MHKKLPIALYRDFVVIQYSPSTSPDGVQRLNPFSLKITRGKLYDKRVSKDQDYVLKVLWQIATKILLLKVESKYCFILYILVPNNKSKYL